MVIKICTRCNKKWKEYNALSYENLCEECRSKKRYWKRNMFPKDKKGASLTGWTEVALGIVLFLGVLAIIVAGMNGIYDKNEDPSFGFATNETMAKFTTYQNKLQNASQEGVSVTSLFGLNLDTTWTMIQVGLTTIWVVISGGWIENAVSLFDIGSVGTLLSSILRLIYLLSIGFILIKLITKVRP